MTDPHRRARIGVVDDHAQIVRGLRATFAEHDALELTAGADTVADLLAITTDLDLVLLDLRLDDGTSPLINIAALTDAGIPVLVYTSGDEMFLVRQAASAGVMGVIRKNARDAELLDGIMQALDGKVVASIDWAAAIDSDDEFVDLPPMQRRVLELYAAGESTSRVAAELHLSTETVADYVSRIRLRYQAVGRPSPTKTDLYKRAIEDGWLPIPRRLRR
ncbi:response regulator transcription factor [Gordonia otitidis]|uniref:Two-component response regulator n=1 Tax=Gordonia otitidis (strain DSM 44809 / CCUG 52243 / JCM 12355 / NBRC 100426 / IFM 10032) TaxID=1108044 RepID=H5TKI6_GORO1|nr:response regulator [Gordonia otitidis]GAB33994.1 putative two-component response regulator [Gordonia otitidis NBRC 100426]